jgi:hypothetical protein
VTIIFFRDRKRRRWCWRVLNAQVTLPEPPAINPKYEPRPDKKPHEARNVISTPPPRGQ